MGRPWRQTSLQARKEQPVKSGKRRQIVTISEVRRYSCSICFRHAPLRESVGNFHQNCISSYIISYVRTYVRKYVRTCTYMHVCMYVSVYVLCMYVLCVYMYVCMYAGVYVCVYVCMHLYYVCMHSYADRQTNIQCRQCRQTDICLHVCVCVLNKCEELISLT